ncbi:MAG: hypothetical protein ACYCS4_14470, partial [Acidimicrobiales bacterium]
MITDIGSSNESISNIAVYDAAQASAAGVVNAAVGTSGATLASGAEPLSSVDAFSVSSGTCANATLTPGSQSGSQCSASITFTPPASGSFVNYVCYSYSPGDAAGNSVDCSYLFGQTIAAGTGGASGSSSNQSMPPGCNPVASGDTFTANACATIVPTGTIQVLPTYDAAPADFTNSPCTSTCLTDPYLAQVGLEGQVELFDSTNSTPTAWDPCTTTCSTTITNTSGSALDFMPVIDSGGGSALGFPTNPSTCGASGQQTYPYALASGATCTVTVQYDTSGTNPTGVLVIESSNGTAVGGVSLGTGTVNPGNHPPLHASFTVTPSNLQTLGTGGCTSTTCTFGLEPKVYGGVPGDELQFTWSWSGTDAAGNSVSGSTTTFGTTPDELLSPPVAISSADTSTGSLPQSGSVPYQVSLSVADLTHPSVYVYQAPAQPLTVSATCTSSDTISIAATGGSNQSTATDTSFANPATATVYCVPTTGSRFPLPGATVNFSAPSTGPSGGLASASATTGSSGTASTTITANSTAGTWTLSATATYVIPATSTTLSTTTPATWSLDNTSSSSSGTCPSGTSLVVEAIGGGQTTTAGAQYATPLMAGFVCLPAGESLGQALASSTRPEMLSGVPVAWSMPTSGSSGTFGASSDASGATLDASATSDSHGMATSPSLWADPTDSTATPAFTVAGSYTYGGVNYPIPYPENVGTSIVPSCAILVGPFGQLATISTAFGTPISVALMCQSTPTSAPKALWSAPSSGASGTFDPSSATTTYVSQASGPSYWIADSTATANATAGTWSATAGATAGTTSYGSVSGPMTNLAGHSSSFALSVTPESCASSSTPPYDVSAGPVPAGTTVTFTIGSGSKAITKTATAAASGQATLVPPPDLATGTPVSATATVSAAQLTAGPVVAPPAASCATPTTTSVQIFEPTSTTGAPGNTPAGTSTYSPADVYWAGGQDEVVAIATTLGTPTPTGAVLFQVTGPAVSTVVEGQLLTTEAATVMLGQANGTLPGGLSLASNEAAYVIATTADPASYQVQATYMG